MIQKFVILLTLLMPVVSSATIFKKVDTNHQIKEADGIIIGQYLKSKSIRLEDGSIATQMYFKMEKEFGLRSDFFGMDEVIIHYPGGTLDGITTHVDGVPEFVMGEKIALYTKSIQNRYWGMNMGLGSYKVVNYGSDILLINSVFPNDARMGQVKLPEFERMVRAIKGTSMKVVQSTQYIENPDSIVARVPASVSEGKNRSLASKIEDGENSEESHGVNPLWLLGFLAFCGGIFRMTRQKRA